MIGTIVNTCTIVAGTLLGTLLHRGIKEKYKEVLYTGLGLASLAIGLNATITHLPQSQYPVLFIVSLAVGGVVGTWLDIDGRFKRLVNRTEKGLISGKTVPNMSATGKTTSAMARAYTLGPTVISTTVSGRRAR